MVLLDKLKLKDVLGFSNFIRLKATNFEDMLLRVGEHISKEETKFRETIPPFLRLTFTLSFLAIGLSVRYYVSSPVALQILYIQVTFRATCLPS